jgi:phage baseplate assembly protein W
MAFEKEYSDIFAYDVDKDVSMIGEVVNEKAINNSIENILLTGYGERMFLPYFGSPLGYIVFESLNTVNGERILDEIIEAIKRWEKRITILENEVELNILKDQNTITIVIPYIINRSGLQSTFSRKIIL